jgi:hypothetical protein
VSISRRLSLRCLLPPPRSTRAAHYPSFCCAASGYVIAEDRQRALLAAVTKERADNDRTIARKAGGVVTYGDTIQLRHVKTGQFLHVMKNSISQSDRSASAVQLSDKCRCVETSQLHV